jgi:hypothetical protein
MPFDNIVVDSVYDRVDVYGDKVFTKDVQIRGPAYAVTVNGFDVQKIYQDTLFANDDVVIDGHVVCSISSDRLIQYPTVIVVCKPLQSWPKAAFALLDIATND